jgi:hypothetical protein
MAQPVTYTYYPVNAAAAGSSHGATSFTAPANTNLTWGWVVNQNTASVFSEMSRSIERAANTFRTVLTASAPNLVGNCWVMGPFHGRFNQGLMKITMSVKATTSATNQDGRFVYRLWSSPTVTGVRAKLITGSYISSSIVTNASTTPTALTGSVNMSLFDLHNEYIFVHTQWSITGPATNNNADINFVIGSAAANITLPVFISHPTTNVTLIQEEYPHASL